MDMIQTIKIMYNTDALVKVPLHVMQALEDVDNLCRQAGGELVSRQIIASIIVKTDGLRSYDKNSEFYIGDQK